MHRSTAGHNPYNLFILTIVYSKKLPTCYLRTIEHMAMFVVKSIHIQINSQVVDLSILRLVNESSSLLIISADCSHPSFCYMGGHVCSLLGRGPGSLVWARPQTTGDRDWPRRLDCQTDATQHVRVLQPRPLHVHLAAGDSSHLYNVLRRRVCAFTYLTPVGGVCPDPGVHAASTKPVTLHWLLQSWWSVRGLSPVWPVHIEYFTLHQLRL